MGQKVNPCGLRLQLRKNWSSIWYSDGRAYIKDLFEDTKIREFLEKKFKHALIARVCIKRQGNIVIDIHATRVGVIVGKNGADVEAARKSIVDMTSCNSVEINVIELKRPETCAKLVASSIAQQLEKRVSFRKAMKRAVSGCLRAGVKGVRVACSGRLGGAEIARTECYSEGQMPLHTLRANVDYAICEAHTTYGVIGTKVWIYN